MRRVDRDDKQRPSGSPHTSARSTRETWTGSSPPRAQLAYRRHHLRIGSPTSANERPTAASLMFVGTGVVGVVTGLSASIVLDPSGKIETRFDRIEARFDQLPNLSRIERRRRRRPNFATISLASTASRRPYVPTSATLFDDCDQHRRDRVQPTRSSDAHCPAVAVAGAVALPGQAGRTRGLDSVDQSAPPTVIDGVHSPRRWAIHTGLIGGTSAELNTSSESVLIRGRDGRLSTGPPANVGGLHGHPTASVHMSYRRTRK